MSTLNALGRWLRQTQRLARELSIAGSMGVYFGFRVFFLNIRGLFLRVPVVMNTSPGIKFRRICLLSCCGGRGVQESAFSLAWLAEEFITWNKFIIL